MNNKNKILLSILAFLLCGVLGFLVTSIFQRSSNDQKYSNNSISVPIASNMSGSSSFRPSSPAIVGIDSQIPDSEEETPEEESVELVEEPILAEEPEMKTPPVISEVSKPIYNAENKTYTFTVSAQGDNLTYCLADKSKNLLAEQKEAEFTVKATTSGKYYVFVSNANGESSDYVEVQNCFYQYPKISVAELQTILNSGNSAQASTADFKNRVAAGCKFVFNGRKVDEGDAPISYNEILQRIKLKTWQSVTVTSVSHMESGKLSKAVMTVNY